MFREIFLFQGKDVDKKIPYFADVINTISDADESQKQHRDKVCDEIVSNIKTAHPEFFDKLKAVIQSDNLYEINAVLVEGSRLSVEALFSSEEYGAYTKQARAFVAKNRSKYNFAENDEDIGRLAEDLKYSLAQNNLKATPNAETCLTIAAVVAGVVWEVAAAVNVVAVATVAVYAAAVFWGPETSATVAPGLDNDRVVVAIAENY